MTVMAAPCLKYVVGMKLVMSYAKNFPKGPLHAPLLAKVVLNAVGHRNTQMSAKKHKRKSAKEHKRAQKPEKGAKDRKKAPPRKNCKHMVFSKRCFSEWCVQRVVRIRKS